MNKQELYKKIEDYCLEEMLPFKDGRVAFATICGASRNQEIVEIRAYVVKLLREEAGFSYKRIGRFINKDHTSAMYLYKEYARNKRN